MWNIEQLKALELACVGLESASIEQLRGAIEADQTAKAIAADLTEADYLALLKVIYRRITKSK